MIADNYNIRMAINYADLLIGAVLIPGARTPKIVTRDMVKSMEPGSAIVDTSVDQGGVCETTHPTTHDDPTYIAHKVVHYCVANMPGAVPRTSTYALTNSTLSYALELADQGPETAMARNRALMRGLNIYQGKVALKAVGEAFGMDYEEPRF